MQVDLFSTLRDRLVVPADDADQTFIVANLEGTGFQPEGLELEPSAPSPRPRAGTEPPEQPPGLIAAAVVQQPDMGVYAR